MKATHIAVTLVVFSVAGVVFLSGVTHSPKQRPPREVAETVAPAPEVVAAPLPPLEGPVWDLPSVDARLRIPAGWSVGRVNGDERLLRDPSDPLDGNVNLMIMPNPFGFSIDELLRENCDELSVNPDLRLEDRRELYVMGRKVLRFDYNGTPRGKTEAVRFVAVVWTRGTKQVVLTTTIRAAAWGEVAADVDAALETLQIRWPPKRSS